MLFNVSSTKSSALNAGTITETRGLRFTIISLSQSFFNIAIRSNGGILNHSKPGPYKKHYQTLVCTFERNRYDSRLLVKKLPN